MLLSALAIHAQAPLRTANNSPVSGDRFSGANATGGYASEVDTVIDAEGQALEQARQLLETGAKNADKAALETAIKEMERSRAALEEARKSPEKLPSAISAEQAAYQALLKAIPREYRMTRSRNRSQSAKSSGQPGEQELNQLDMPGEENRYETESQAEKTQSAQQTEQAQTVDRLKQLARRQQDLNERLRDLQASLQEARTDQEREEIKRQLKRLRDEERQMLSDVDELRQKLEQSPNATSQASARQQLEQTRNDVQRAAEQLDKQSVSEALAAGARAEQKLQDLKENMRQQTSSQFSQEMRQLRNQARDLAEKQNQIARDLENMGNSGAKPLDDSAQRKELVDKMAAQKSALTNLLGGVRAVTEQAETPEPLLSKQMYEILRRSDQQHTDSQLEVGSQLVDRGFLPQATQVAQAAGTNIDELRRSVDRAAESVLGSEADALRRAQKELDDLAEQVARDMTPGTNAQRSSAANGSRKQGGTNSPAMARNDNSGNNGGEQANPNANPNGDPNANPGESPSESSGGGQSGDKQNPSERSGNKGNNPGATAQNDQKGSNEPKQSGNAQSSQAGTRSGNQARGRSDGNSEGNSGENELSNFTQQLGGGKGNLGLNGPITGNNYVDWSDRLRDVEQSLDSQDLRNQLALVRERVGVYRRAYRLNDKMPSGEELQNRVLTPLSLARDWVGQELSRAQNDRSLVPLDRDPVQDKYSELVRKYYEKLGSAQ